MARAAKKGVRELLTSWPVLIPVLAALSLLEIAFFLELDLSTWGMVVAAFGGFAVLAFVGQWLFGGGPRVPADVQQARDEMTANLDTLARALSRRMATESTPAGSMAPVEK